MIIDLTMPINERTPNWPDDPQIKIEQCSTVEQDSIAKKNLTFHSHFSTHIDAPSHMILNGKTLSDYKIEKFAGECIVIDVRGQKEIDAKLDEVKEGDIVFFLTGHSNNASDPNYFTDNPVLTPNTAQNLVDRKASIIGMDSPTPDNEPYTLHKLFLKHDILIVENLVNLEQLAGKRFQCYILPLKIENGDGAPCRVIAVL